MAIRQNADAIHFLARPEERALALKMDEAFDITHGTPYGDKSAWCAAPKDQVQERFGLKNEILVIYSPQLETDARVLTAIEHFSRNPDFKHRVDKVVYLVIHNGNQQQTQDLVRQDLDRIIIPIEASQLLSNARGSIFLRSTIAKYTGEIDLFGMSSPVSHDKYFFGREDIVHALVTRAATKGENSGLFGLRKTGKTSVLKAIQRRLHDRAVLAEYSDCSNPGIHAARWWEVLENLRNKLASSCNLKFGKKYEATSEYTPTIAGSRFSSAVIQFQNECSLDRIVLMLDEIEYVTPNISGALGRHWDTDFIPFWQTIRSIHQEMNGRLVFIVAGVNPACVELPQISASPNPIFQLALPHYLESFSTPSVREMVRTIGRYSGIKFKEDVYDYLRSFYGGHPFLIRIACSEVSSSKARTDPVNLLELNIEDFKRKSPEIQRRLISPIRDILLSLAWWYPEEYDLLQILAQGDAEFFKAYLQEKPDSVVQFAKYGILDPSTPGQFAINDLKQFIKQHGQDYKRALSPFTRGDIPPELLPEVPDLEALGKLFTKKCELEIKLRRAIMIYLGFKFNWDSGKIANAIAQGLDGGSRSTRGSPHQLFLGREPQDVMNELFTLDLKKVIVANWDTFSQLFESNKARFEMNMDTVNIARRVDSHTKPISQREFDNFNNSYDWVLTRVSKIPQMVV